MTKTVTDELESIVSELCGKFPDHSEDQIASLAHDVYGRLSSEATVTAHLIPLTMNRCHKVLMRGGTRARRA
jgi:hypothetical protein